ncbi:hypothetical protein GGR51DRAFT_559773 [Nemania sp. FL0031]|nr:hypothetical protein GGR51DRAFT_559773 [Nemania sp. FL0031]
MASKHPPLGILYEFVIAYANIIRHLHNHPEYFYLQPPNAQFIRPDYNLTPRALYKTTEFIEWIYYENLLPLLPYGAPWKCKETGNLWNYINPYYKDANGIVVDFPMLSEPELEKHYNLITSMNFMIKKIILENDTDPMAQALLDNQPFDFGGPVKHLVRLLSFG